VENDPKSKIKNKSLDALMLGLLWEKDLKAMDWSTIFDIWNNMSNCKVVF
jgi:hypothetical protein